MEESAKKGINHNRLTTPHSVFNMRIYWFQTRKGHTTFLFGQVSTLGLCFGFKSVIDVTLSIWFQEPATTRLPCPICACIIFTQWRDILCFVLVELARLGFVLVLKAWSMSRLAYDFRNRLQHAYRVQYVHVLFLHNEGTYYVLFWSSWHAWALFWF